MNRTSLHRLSRLLLSAAVVIAITKPSLNAEQVILEATVPSGTSAGAPAPCPGFCVAGFSGTISTSKSSAPGTNPSRYGSRLGAAGTPSFTVSPTLSSVGVYRIYVTHIAGNASPDIVVNVSATDGDLSATSTEMFRATNAINVWGAVGYITNTTTTPTVTFTYASGTLAGTGGRFYADAVMFESLDPCTGVSPTLGSVGGPLVAGQTFVNVLGVASGATNVTVYADGVEIGSLTTGVVAGANTVTTTALVKDQQITATQIKNGCVSTRPLAGPPVGGGANPKVRVSLSLGKNPALTGPIGTNSATPANVYMLKATGTSAGFASAPLGGYELTPETCWKTLTFVNDTDSSYVWNGTATLPNTDAFGSLEGLALCIDNVAPDSGPYDIYIDSIMNGDTVIEGFEGFTNDAPNVFFQSPGAAAIPQPKLLSQPNSTAVSQNNVADGTNALRVRWQFNTVDPTSWVHLLANGAGHTYPQVDLRKPISIRMLVLPAGQPTGTKFNGTVSSITNTASPAYATTTNTFGVTVTGPGTYTYQWSWSGGALPNLTTEPTYTIDGGGTGVSSADNGTYTVEVSDGTCTETRSIAFSVVDPLPIITNQPAPTTIAHVGETASFTVEAGAPVAAGLPLTYQWRFNDTDIVDATAATFTTNNVQIADAGYYTVVVGNVYGSVTSQVAVLDVVQPAVVIGTGTGLRGNYYTSSYSTNPFAGPITLSRIDPTVDFNWGQGTTGFPAPGISADFFTVRWTGQVRALDTDTYTFYVRSDDGQRLWVDGQLLVNDWALHGATEQSGTIALTANQHYDLVMEYFEGAVAASAQLSWSAAGGGVVKGIIPTSQLYPSSGSVSSPALNFNLDNGTNLVFNWGPGTYTLVWSTNAAGPYTNRINGVVSPYTHIIGSEPQKFFRLQLLQ
jgi:hypothetical protein